MAKTRVYNIYLLHVIEVMNMKQLGVREYTEKDIVSVVRKCLIIPHAINLNSRTF